MAYHRRKRSVGNRYRSKMPGHKSRRLFTRTAKKVHRRNGRTRVMRGGIRL